jgi:hypothetical protein
MIAREGVMLIERDVRPARDRHRSMIEIGQSSF